MTTDWTKATDVELRIKIAELNGCKYYQSGGNRIYLMQMKPPNPLWREVEKPEKFIISNEVPNYPTDLNDVTEVRKRLFNLQPGYYDRFYITQLQILLEGLAGDNTLGILDKRECYELLNISPRVHCIGLILTLEWKNYL